jgi:PadR family transcriptional regulator, regulatory protein AphA
MSTRSLTTTSYAILGLLAIQPWSTYELAQLMKRSLHFIWPRAESNLYAEPKRLVEDGYATATEEWTGDRKRTVYAITAEGREALRGWLRESPAGQRLESEAALRILYGNLGSKADLQAAIARVAADAEEAIAHFCRLGDEYARGDGAFPERIHVNALLLTLMVEQARAASSWAEWAAAEVESWEETATPDVDWATRSMGRVIDGDGRASDAP